MCSTPGSSCGTVIGVIATPGYTSADEAEYKKAADGLIEACREITKAAQADNFAGFNENLENIYYVRIPAVLEQFDAQFAHLERAAVAEGDVVATQHDYIRPLRHHHVSRTR